MLMGTSLIGAVLFALWLTAVVISPITLFAQLVLPTTRLVRAYADRIRRDVFRAADRTVRRRLVLPLRSAAVLADAPRLFGRPFGGLLEFSLVAQSCVMMPLALVCFGLWYALVLPLTRTELSLTRRLLPSS